MSQTFGAWRATYIPGSWVVLTGPSSLVVMQPAAPRHSGLVSSIWRHVAEAKDPESLVETLSIIGLAKMPSLGAFFWVDGEMYSLARGQIVVKDASTGEIVNHGDGLLTWSEKKLNPATIVVEMEQAGQGLSMPLLLGVAQASKLIIDATGNVEPFIVPQTDEVHRPRVLGDDALKPWTSESDEAHKADESEALMRRVRTPGQARHPMMRTALPDSWRFRPRARFLRPPSGLRLSPSPPQVTRPGSLTVRMLLPQFALRMIPMATGALRRSRRATVCLRSRTLRLPPSSRAPER
ncbi:hypothetical protein JCM18916_3648 [Cutibacterium acnes JCM 18916]|nr:hypothetical protein JCM18916_3648 [Cutibacterium acnes JCM 18916]